MKIIKSQNTSFIGIAFTSEVCRSLKNPAVLKLVFILGCPLLKPNGRVQLRRRRQHARLCSAEALRRAKEIDVTLGWVHHCQWLPLCQVSCLFKYKLNPDLYWLLNWDEEEKCFRKIRCRFQTLVAQACDKSSYRDSVKMMNDASEVILDFNYIPETPTLTL